MPAALLTANSLAHSSSVFFSNGFSFSIVQFSLLHTDVSVFWKTKSCLIFDIHLSLDPLAAVGYICNTHTHKKRSIMNEMNIREGPPVVMLTTFIGHNLFHFHLLHLKRNGEGSPPFFFPLSTFFLQRLSFQVDDNKLSESFLSFFGGVWHFSRNLFLEENAQRLYNS